MTNLNNTMKFKDKEMAEHVLKNIVHKDFWAVNDYQDNREILQSLIDVLFNSIEGNDYGVEYQDYQNGTRLVITCKVCSKDMTSYDPFIAHENGKRHKKVRHRMLTGEESKLESLELQPHNKPREIFPEGSLEDQIDSTKFPVLGMQFVYKEVIDGRDTYTCQLCQENAAVHQISSGKMFSHLTSEGHSHKYLEVKYGYYKKSAKDFEEECLSIMEFEGRIHTNIVDLTIELPCSKSSEASHSVKSISPKEEIIPKSEPPEVNIETQTCAKPETCDIGASADLTSKALFIRREINALEDLDCRKVLQDDEDMQDLLKETLWELGNKMEKYYKRTGKTYNEGTNKTPLYGKVLSFQVYGEKVKQYVAELAE